MPGSKTLKSVKETLNKPSNATILGLTIFRVFLQTSGFYHWNGDIQAAIIPGLQCWYCQPWQAPYGTLWHLISYPLQPNFILLTSLVDGVILFAIRNLRMFPVYIFCSGWIWFQAPYDLPILWLSLFGLVWWPLTAMGPLGKIPLENQAALHYVLSRPYNINDFQYYALMGVVFIAVLWTSLHSGDIVQKIVEKYWKNHSKPLSEKNLGDFAKLLYTHPSYSVESCGISTSIKRTFSLATIQSKMPRSAHWLGSQTSPAQSSEQSSSPS
jgi:hypothetical protein